MKLFLTSKAVYCEYLGSSGGYGSSGGVPEVRESGMEVREGGTEVRESGTEVRGGTGRSGLQNSQGIHSIRKLSAGP